MAAAAAALAAAPHARAGDPIEDPIPAPIETGDITVKLILLTDGLTAPNWGTHAPGHSGRLFVTDQDGILWNVDLESGARSVFLDVSGIIVELGAFGEGTFDERGLLGVAFDPEYQETGLVYTYTSQPVDGEADFSTMPDGEEPNHQTVITEWHVANPADPDATVDPDSARELLRVDEPQFNHNAGAMNFGPDGMLYIALGDGGRADDQGIGHSEQGNGQDLTNPLGDILRIDPSGDNSANGQYGIPADNPFINTNGAVDEIYAYGFRNPFRFSFDSETGDLYVGDVGQNAIEEIDIVVSGGNYGWRVKEGTFLFDPNGDQQGFVFQDSPGDPPDMIDPIAQYDHDEGIAIIGGFVYRGDANQVLDGRYVFGEFATTFSNDGRLFYLAEDNTIFEFDLFGQDAFGLSLLGMGRDANGEVYFLANGTGIPFEETGVVFGAFAGRLASVDEAAVALGSIASGGVEDLAESDDVSLETVSEPGFGAFEANVVDLRIVGHSDLAAPDAAYIAVESRLDNPGGMSRWRLERWSTGGFATIAQHPVGVTDERRETLVADIGPFVRNADGRIELSLRTTVVATFTPNGFRWFVDQVEVLVN
jgi:glucose/arabinose dehydrogenase